MGGGETVASAGKPRTASAESTQRLKQALAKLEAANAFAEQAVARSSPSSSASGRGANKHENHGNRGRQCNQTVYKMNNGMSYLPYAEQPKAVPPRFGQPSPAFSEEIVRKRLAEVDKPPPVRMQMPSSGQSSERDGEVHRGSQNHLPLRTGPVSYTLDTFAEFLQDPRRESSLSVAGITNETRMTRRKQQEEARARQKASRMDRQLSADRARVEYGQTSKEKKERQKRTEKLAQQAFDVAQIAAGHDYKKRSKRVILANTLSLIAQIVFVFDVSERPRLSPVLVRSLPTGAQRLTACSVNAPCHASGISKQATQPSSSGRPGTCTQVCVHLHDVRHHGLWVCADVDHDLVLNFVLRGKPLACPESCSSPFSAPGLCCS